MIPAAPPTPRRGLPVVPTLIVALAMAVMVALGLWQLLDRLPRKEAFLAQIAQNPGRAAIAFPRTPDDRLLFRRSAAACPGPVSVRIAGAGGAGYRAIGTCADGLIVQLGTTRNPRAAVAWDGGMVAGHVSHAPDARSLIASLFDRTPTAMMLVADPPVAGLSPNPKPDVTAIPNSHLAYAGQWFFFAAVAGIIYGLAVRRRHR